MRHSRTRPGRLETGKQREASAIVGALSLPRGAVLASSGYGSSWDRGGTARDGAGVGDGVPVIIVPAGANGAP